MSASKGASAAVCIEPSSHLLLVQGITTSNVAGLQAISEIVGFV